MGSKKNKTKKERDEALEAGQAMPIWAKAQKKRANANARKKTDGKSKRTPSTPTMEPIRRRRWKKSSTFMAKRKRLALFFCLKNLNYNLYYNLN